MAKLASPRLRRGTPVDASFTAIFSRSRFPKASRKHRKYYVLSGAVQDYTIGIEKPFGKVQSWLIKLRSQGYDQLVVYWTIQRTLSRTYPLIKSSSQHGRVGTSMASIYCWRLAGMSPTQLVFRDY